MLIISTARNSTPTTVFGRLLANLLPDRIIKPRGAASRNLNTHRLLIPFQCTQAAYRRSLQASEKCLSSRYITSSMLKSMALWESHGLTTSPIYPMQVRYPNPPAQSSVS